MNADYSQLTHACAATVDGDGCISLFIAQFLHSTTHVNVLPLTMSTEATIEEAEDESDEGESADDGGDDGGEGAAWQEVDDDGKPRKFSLSVLEFLHNLQAQHGLRHDDFER